MVEWVWEDRKAAANYRKHRVLFETAVVVFDDDRRIAEPDPHWDDDRWRTIGMVGTATLLVVHTVIEPDGSGRIISARRATPTERKSYERLYF